MAPRPAPAGSPAGAATCPRAVRRVGWRAGGGPPARGRRAAQPVGAMAATTERVSERNGRENHGITRERWGRELREKHGITQEGRIDGYYIPGISPDSQRDPRGQTGEVYEASREHRHSQAGAHSKSRDSCQGPHTKEANKAGKGAAHQACMTGSQITGREGGGEAPGYTGRGEREGRRGQKGTLVCSFSLSLSLGHEKILSMLLGEREHWREEERDYYTFQPHRADAGAARTSPGRSQEEVISHLAYTAKETQTDIKS